MKLVSCVSLLAVLGGAGCFGGFSSNHASSASAFQIASTADLIGGPSALGQVGDFKLQNGKVRAIIQGPGFSRGFGVYGGSLIDADLRRPNEAEAPGSGNGNDRFGELFPAFFLEAIDPNTVTVANDGSDGNPARIVATGHPGAFLTEVNLINNLILPSELQFSVEYSLGANDQFVTITSTMTNTSPSNENFPQLSFSGLTLPVPLGDIALFGSSNKVFIPGVAGFDVRWTLPAEVAASPKTLPALPGIISDFIASKNDGVSYGIFAEPTPRNFAWLNRDQYGPQTDQGSLEVPFFFSSFLGYYYSLAPSTLPPGQSFSYKQYFVIGRGDVAAIRDVFHSVRGTPVGTFGGRVRDRTTLIPVANTSVVVDDASGNPFNQHTTDTNGNFVGNLPPGNYAYRVVDDKYYTQAPVPFTVKQGQTTSADIYVDTPAYITVQVTDERGLAMPAKVSLEGTFPLPPNDPTTGLPLDPRFFLFDLKRGERRRPTALSGDHTDYTARKFLEEQYWTPNGVVGDTSRAGHFTVWVSHGLEYDAYSQDVDLVSGQGVTIAATLHHVVDTTNYVGGDLHLHSMNSIDSGQPVPARVVGLAAEGLEFGVATDHNFITDYSPQVVQYNLQQWFMPVVGIELTTLELGHFNGYPLDYNLATSTHGSFSWFNRPSQSIFDELRSIGKYGPSNTIVQVNHPRDSITGYFNDLNLDPDMAVSQPQFGLIVPQGDPFSPSQFSTDFDALEVFNGKRRDILRTLKVPAVLPASGNYPATDTIPGQPLRTAKGAIAYPGGVDDWFHLLNLGYRFTAMGNSDSHSNNYEEPGFPRTFVRIGTDDPFQIRDLALAQAIKAHKTTMTNCAFVELRVDGNEIGSDMTYHAPSAQVSVRIQKAPWVQIDTLNLYVNSSGDPLVSFPLANLGDQTIDYSLTINRDSWIVAEVTGTQSLWPLVTGIEEPPLTAANAIGTLGATFGIDSNPLGDLTPSLVTPAIPYALTNPIWIDYDGDGQFTPPGNTARVIPASVAAAASLAPAIPVKRKGAQMGDIRVIFRAFSDSHPNGD